MQHHALYQTETQRIIGVLQHWQALLTPPCDSQTATITLADVQNVVLALQQAFGPGATLETIIQQLVAQDLREQVERRRQTQRELAGAAA